MRGLSILKTDSCSCCIPCHICWRQQPQQVCLVMSSALVSVVVKLIVVVIHRLLVLHHGVEHADCALLVPTTSRSATTSSQDTCSVNTKLLNLWNFEQHCSHATCDRKCTTHVSTSNIKHVSHHIRRLLSVHMCAGCSMQCVYTDFQSALSPISLSLRSLCPQCSESMGEHHWAHTWAQAVVGVLQSSHHLGRHCCVQHQQLQIVANSVHHFHPHLDSTPSKHAEGYHDGIPRVAGGATEPTQTPCGPFSEVMVKTTFDLVASSTKTPD